MVEVIIKDTAGPWLKNLSRQLSSEYPKAASAGLNRTADSARSLAVKEIARNIGAKQKTVRDATKVSKANPNKLEARVTAFGKRIPIYDLTARQTAKGVTYKAGEKGRKLIPSAFIAEMKSGHVGVFKRQGKERLPIHELKGPSVPVVFARQKIQAAVLKMIDERLEKEIDQALKYFEGKAKS
jgi:hypothetical protein